MGTASLWDIESVSGLGLSLTQALFVAEVQTYKRSVGLGAQRH